MFQICEDMSLGYKLRSTKGSQILRTHRLNADKSKKNSNPEFYEASGSRTKIETNLGPVPSKFFSLLDKNPSKK